MYSTPYTHVQYSIYSGRIYIKKKNIYIYTCTVLPIHMYSTPYIHVNAQGPAQCIQKYIHIYTAPSCSSIYKYSAPNIGVHTYIYIYYCIWRYST